QGACFSAHSRFSTRGLKTDFRLGKLPRAEPTAEADINGGVTGMGPTRLKRALVLLVSIGLLAGVPGVLAFPSSAAEQPAKATAPALVRTAKSGAWSAPATWEGGKIPSGNVRVLIREGHTVVYDLQATEPVRSLTISGVVSFASDKDTQLAVGLIKIQPGEDCTEEGFACDLHAGSPDAVKPRAALEVGTPDQPIPAGRTATIRLVYMDGLDKQSCPAIVCCGGRMDFHGQPMNHTWVKRGTTAKKGESAITLAEEVSGWKVGDRIIVTMTGIAPTSAQSHPGSNPPGTTTEERTIKAIDGTKLTLSAPLE